jgi:hypothetical protein
MHPATRKAIDILIDDKDVYDALRAYILADKDSFSPLSSTLTFVQYELPYFSNETLTEYEIDMAEWNEVLMFMDIWDD